MKYTVRQATPTGKSDPTYGNEYIVHFNEDQREVKLSRKQPVDEGQEMFGTIVDGKYGAYFKKDATQWNPSPSTNTTSQALTPNGVVTKPYVKPAYKDNSDGQRQGMCLNNAANFVNALGEAVEPSVWAKTVHTYASALYLLGDLNQESSVQAAKDVFGV
jgi:hypothetical protein